MCFDQGSWEKGSQGVNPATLKRLGVTASVLAEAQGQLWEADPHARRNTFEQARPHLIKLCSELNDVRSQSKCPQALPPATTREEELLQWAAGFAWNHES